jgi:16S rRNA processing protein RimM
MNKEDFYYLGKISKPFGSKGQVVAFLDVDDPIQYKKMESVFLDLDGEWVPFLISSVEIQSGRKVLLHFEDVCNAQDAAAYSGREMYLPLDILPPLKGKKFYYHEVKGFTVIDAVQGAIGNLKQVMDLPKQSLLQIAFPLSMKSS